MRRLVPLAATSLLTASLLSLSLSLAGCAAPSDEDVGAQEGAATSTAELGAARKALADLALKITPLKQRELSAAEIAATHASLAPRTLEVAGVTGKLSARGLEGVKNNHPAKSTLQTVDIDFGKITRPQFDALVKEFGGRAKVTFDAARSYSAFDFLPPAVQAIANVDLAPPASVLVPGTKKFMEDFGKERDVNVSMSLNCHGTSWEAMRAFYQADKAEVDVFLGDSNRMTYALTDPSRFEEIGRAKTAETSSLVRDLRPGDIVAFFQQEGEEGATYDAALLHTAVYAGGGLLLDKADTELPPMEGVPLEDFPVRLTTLAASADTVTQVIREPVAAVVYRAKGGVVIPKPTEIFGFFLGGENELATYMKRSKLVLPGDIAPVVTAEYSSSNWERVIDMDMIAVERRTVVISASGGRATLGARPAR